MRRYLAAPVTVPTLSLTRIPTGFDGTRRTVTEMQRLIRSGAKDFYVRQKAIDILLESSVRPKDYLGEIDAIFRWVQRNVRYVKDPVAVEVLHTPRRMLELRAGDCDDMTIVLGAMLEAIGHPVRLVIIGPDPRRPRLFNHVYLEAYLRGGWIPLDPTMPHPMGWSPLAWTKQVIPIERRPDVEDAIAGFGAPPPPWLRELVGAIRRGGIRPRDPRVKRLWDLLRQRRLLGRSPWLQALLRRVWARGLPAHHRPRTTRRLVGLLRRWGVIPAQLRPGVRRPIAIRPLAVRPVPPRSRVPPRTVAVRRPATPIRVQPVHVRPVGTMSRQPVRRTRR